MPNPIPLISGHYYHIYNRANNKEILFREERNYLYFLRLYAKYISQIADAFAYCLLPNHFHFLVRIKSAEEIYKSFYPDRDTPKPEIVGQATQKYPSKGFSNLFNAYAKAFNKSFKRTGNLFQRPFRRKLVENDEYFKQLVIYIHFNPQNHGLIEDFQLWPYSSYKGLIANCPTYLDRDTVMDLFGGIDPFNQRHAEYQPGILDEEC